MATVKCASADFLGFTSPDSWTWPLSPKSLKRLTDIEKDRAEIGEKLDVVDRKCGKALYQLLMWVIVYLALAGLGAGFGKLLEPMEDLGQALVCAFIIEVTTLVAFVFELAISSVMAQWDMLSDMSGYIGYLEITSADLIKELKKELELVTEKQAHDSRSMRDRMDILERPIRGRCFMLKWVIGIGALGLVCALIFIAAMWFVLKVCDSVVIGISGLILALIYIVASWFAFKVCEYVF